jgi:T4-like virus Myoviridae tail sheath stabiliser
MFYQTYYHSIIRKYVTLFGTLFDSISITRTNNSGQMTELIKVPITYSPKEKMLARLNSDPNIDRQTATPTLPLMAFEMTSISYDGNRKLNTVNKVVVSQANNANIMKYQYNPVPYNIGFKLHVMVKNAEDGTKIIEQILPYFTPDWTTTVQLIPEMEITQEIPIILDSVAQEDVYEGQFTERRSLTWTLDFTLKGFIYGPVKTGAIIKFANSVFYTPSVADGTLSTAVGNTNPAAFLQTQPGLLPNGQPTANSSASIDPNLITATSDFGYVQFNTNTGV